MNAPQPRPIALGDLLRRHRSQVLELWERAVRTLPSGRRLPAPALIDAVPKLLDSIANMADDVAAGRRPRAPRELTEAHAWERLSVGFDVDEVAAEYAALRSSVSQVLLAQPLADPVASMQIVSEAIDHAVFVAVQQFKGARERALDGLDRISTAYLGSEDLSSLLEGLLRVLAQAAEAVDTAAILLREDDRLCVRAAVGFDEDFGPGVSLRIGEGFAGTVAAERRPMHLDDAESDPRVVRHAMRRAGLKGLWGVPLLDGDHLLGVAHMGSTTMRRFSPQDQRLFHTLASRATAVISRALLRERLEDERNRFVSLVDQLDHAVVWEADANLQFTFVSRRAPLLTGTTVEAWMSTQDFWGTQVPPEDRERVRETLNTVLRERGTKALRHRMHKANGELVWVQTGLQCSDRGGKSVVSGVSVDVTDLVKAIQGRDDVLAVVSHDLRNPLSVIRVSAGGLSTLPGSSEQAARARRSGDRILRAVQRMDRLIDDLVDYASIGAGRFSISLGPCDMKALIEEQVTELSDEARARGVELHAHVDEARTLTVACDRGRLLQVLANLTENALHFAPAGGRIELAVRMEASQIVCSVSDTGPGLTAEQRVRVFDRYFRGESSAYEGTGLGLAICKGIVEAHGGRIWVESKPGTETRFSFSLPVSSAGN